MNPELESSRQKAEALSASYHISESSTSIHIVLSLMNLQLVILLIGELKACHRLDFAHGKEAFFLAQAVRS